MKLTNFIGVAGITIGIGIVSNNQLVSANSVNDYILGQKFPKLKHQNKINQWLNNPNWEGVNMRYRTGKPEGVVVHETANSSDKYNGNAIWDEINYMLNNAGSAFVHSFVDANNVVEIANPSYMAWGSGAEGNRRFIQTESTEVNNKNDFAREIWNMANLQADYLHQFGLKPSLGGTVWSHAMVSKNLGGTDHTDPNGYWASSASQFFNSTYTMNDYEALLERVYQSKNAKYKVGQRVQINSNATNEANGYNLRDHQNWVGTIKSVENTNAANSNHAYYIDYGDGNHNDHVLEQDLKAASAAKFKAGQKVQVSYNAYCETNGYSLKAHQGQVGTIKSVQIKNHDQSHYEYYLVYSNKSISVHVSEQDLSANIIYAKPKYGMGQKVQVSNNAWAETNGYSLVNRQGEIGVIQNRTYKKHDRSNFEYVVKFTGGTNYHISEQDLSNNIINMNPKFKVGQSISIANNAWAETNGYDLRPNRNRLGVIQSYRPKNHDRSKIEYTISYGDGTHNDHVAEQDIKSAISRYKIGQRVQIANNAWAETNGYTLTNRHNWIGTVKSIRIKNHDKSKFEYLIVYDNGLHNDHVSEQDLHLPTSSSSLIVSTETKADTLSASSSSSSLSNAEKNRSNQTTSSVLEKNEERATKKSNIVDVK